VRDFYEQARSDAEITSALIDTIRQFSEIDSRIIPYVAADVMGQIKFADPNKPLGNSRAVRLAHFLAHPTPNPHG
jgi:hypothetical protein